MQCDVLVKELVLRFFMGGVAVSFFAAVAELFKPKTFSGIFGAPPAVALVAKCGAMVALPSASLGWAVAEFRCGG